MTHANPHLGIRPGTPAAPRLGARGWLSLTALFVFMLINFGDKALLGIAAGPLTAELHISASQYGFISSSFFFLYSISSLVVGFLTIRYRAKRILTVLAIIWTLAQAVLISPLAGFWTLALTRTLLGAGEGPAYGTANHAAMQWFPKQRRGIAAAVVGVGVPAGTMIAAPLVGQLVAGIGWRESFGVLALASLLWTVVWALAGREGPHTAEAEADSAHETSTERSYWSILASRTFIGCLLGGIAAYWMVVLLISWIPVYLTKTQGYGPAQLGWAVSIPWAVQVAVNVILVGWVGTALVRRGTSSRVARGVVSSLAVALSGAALFAFLAHPTGALGTTLLALAFGLGACIIPASQAILGEICTLRQRGAVLGIYTAVYSLTGVVAPLLTGAVVQAAPDPAAGFASIFVGSAILCILAGAAGTILINPERDAPAPANG